jgi:cyclophilin family peptidyl-prolyl cis-trans isomerase
MPTIESRSPLSTVFSFDRAAFARIAGSPRRPAEILITAILIWALLPLVGCGEQSGSAQAEASDPAIEKIDAFIAQKAVDRDTPMWRTQLSKPPKLTFDPERTYYWKLDTNVGVIQFKLFTDVAPMHASSTIFLTRIGYYDTLKFHRVIQGFMAQGGDPLGNGRGGPGYKYAGEFSPDTLHDSIGILSMANSGPGTDGSQFFITFKATPMLNGRHTVFGKAESEESLATIKAMEALGRPRDPAPPTEPLFIKKATILIE